MTSANIGVLNEDADVREEPENEATLVESEQETETEELQTQNAKSDFVENDAEEAEEENMINYDPGTWKNINQWLRGLLVRKGHVRIILERFSKDSNNQHFSSMH
ncbi:hypothetical protein POM88_017012 [Heracleum sosnowskyi]|uniref:Uncharacterized protein n=1 Tax=Heracleum sosnowskyi TaxID=360622 RepID=A0AAD8MXM6_9APIA|nr:hypothetical protein POM88_017012 [Heracleum sosnowskyi]